MDITFGTATEIPKIVVKRESAPNPFAGHFPSDDKALPVVMTDTSEESLNKAVGRLVARARQAAADVDRTARKSVTITTDGTGKAKTYTATILFWTVARQTRPGSGNQTA